MDEARTARAVRELLASLGLDPDAPELQATGNVSLELFHGTPSPENVKAIANFAK